MAQTVTRSTIADWWRYLTAPTPRADMFYDLAGEQLLVARSSVPLANMGYWDRIDPAAADSLEQANLALFDLVIDAAGMAAADTLVVDVGSGFGVCAVRAAQRAAGCAVVGVNLSGLQLRLSRARAHHAGLSRRVGFARADAGCLPFADASVDRVLSVEAAFHFEQRDTFFAEVRRVLKPGGRLSMVDLVPLPSRGLRDRLAWRFTRRGLSIPDVNITRLDDYRRALERAGLAVTIFRSIVEKVYTPFRRWQLSQPVDVLRRVPPLLALSSAGFLFYPWDYVQVVAERVPADGAAADPAQG